MHIAGQAIELSDNHRAPKPFRLLKCTRELRPAVKRVSTLASLDLDLEAASSYPLLAAKA
jgi:hypothetical protein